MFPSWPFFSYQPPYWYNYYYYFYNRHPMLQYDYDDEDKDEDEDYEHHRELENYGVPEIDKPSEDLDPSDKMYRYEGEQESGRQMPPSGQYTPGAPAQFPIGTSGHYGSAPEINPIGKFNPSSGTMMSPREILRMVESQDPDIMRAMASYGVPTAAARQIMLRIIQASLRFCR